MYFKNLTNKDRDPIIFWSIILSLSFAVFIFLVWVVLYQNLPPQLPLFYSLSWGEKQLVSSQRFTLLPVMILLLTLINLIISMALHQSQLYIKRIIAVTTAAIALLILITAVRIIFIFL